MPSHAKGDTPSERFFDDLAGHLSSESISRRRALRLAGASLLGAVGLASFPGPAEAAPTCARRGAGCTRRCKRGSTRKECFCIRTASGSRRCVHPCCSDRPCTSANQCRSGEVCMKSGCCGERPTCVKLCDKPRPNYCGDGPESERGVAWT